MEEDYVKTLLLHSTLFAFPKGVELILNNQFVQFDEPKNAYLKLLFCTYHQGPGLPFCKVSRSYLLLALPPRKACNHFVATCL